MRLLDSNWHRTEWEALFFCNLAVATIWIVHVWTGNYVKSKWSMCCYPYWWKLMCTHVEIFDENIFIGEGGWLKMRFDIGYFEDDVFVYKCLRTVWFTLCTLNLVAYVW